MKKSLVALAVSSAAFASISAYAAEDTTVGFFGNIQYAYVTKDPKVGNNTNAFEDNGSSFGFKGESKVSDMTTAYFYVKYKVPATRNATTGTSAGDIKFKMDKAFVGLKGDFGNVKVGSFDSIYNDAIQDPIDQLEYISMTNNKTSAKGKTVAYFSPTISGFQVQVSAGLGEDDGTGVKSIQSNSNTTYTGVVKYSNDLVTVALGYDSLTNQNKATVGAANALGDTVGITATVMPIENLSVSGKYEKTSDADSSNAGKKAFGLATRYGYGMGDMYASYENVKPDAAGSDDFNEYAFGVTYSINSSMYVYTELGRLTSNKVKTTAMGVTYSF
ncbi:Major outer membrane protein P.IB precursor [Marinomonas spartinae]|uniref:Major outer membrane protein P.IB n=1 Tax=Marinomonas spartinae TaxID=1792290 RepID=A0A1A8TKN6_9GAMM|nr:porin [Marinomonas spartinae]SBS26680.1 Major outer membrane protein P.IB precursor [Marinomonas spartinae]SBS32925.1 Major outer membrane protein P.IB precursor [Marinomonas spartinae]